MPCSKCQKNFSGTSLATPGVKKKSDMYYGSPASSATGSKSATLGQTGVGKSKLLSKGAKNPYAAYSASCQKCKTKISQGHSYCNKCSYQLQTCTICGKKDKKASGSGSAPVVSGQKYTLK